MINHKIRKYRYLILLLIVYFFNQTAYAQSITIRGKIPVYIYPNESAPVRRAASDLLRDLNTVFGQASSIVSELPEAGPVIVIATGDHYKGSQPPVNGWEAHQLYADKGRIILTGADMRGTI